MPCDLFYANITNASTICSGRGACRRHVICSLGDQFGKERGACFQIARLFAVIFLHQREAHASDMLVSFLGGQLCMERGACLRHAMLFAFPCDLALVSFVRRICFGIGCDRRTIRICIKKGLTFILVMS